MGLFDFLFGSPKVPEANWDEMGKLMKLGIHENRYDQDSLFTNQRWDEDKKRLTQSINPELQGGWDAMMERINRGTEQSPQRDKFAALQAAYESGTPIRPNRVRRERTERERPVARGPGKPVAMTNEMEQARRYKGYA